MADSGLMNNYQLFPAAYFTGADVYISMNGQIFDDVCLLEFEMTESIVPVYGYASYTYDAVAHGSRIVQGRFGINFLSSGRVPAMLSTAANTIASSTSKSRAIASGMSSDQVIAWMRGQHPDKVKDMAEQLENQIWGVAPSTAGSQGSIGDKKDRPFFVPVGGTLHQRGFDIVATFGREGLGAASGTIVTLNRCHLYGQSQRISTDGGNIVEVYQFIARDMNTTIK